MQPCALTRVGFVAQAARRGRACMAVDEDARSPYERLCITPDEVLVHGPALGEGAYNAAFPCTVGPGALACVVKVSKRNLLAAFRDARVRWSVRLTDIAERAGAHSPAARMFRAELDVAMRVRAPSAHPGFEHGHRVLHVELSDP